VSTTVSVQEGEWDEVGDWMWKHRDSYNGLAVLPFQDHSFQQAPFEECDAATYERLAARVFDLDLAKVRENVDDTDFGQAAACAGGACEV
jgi:ribonucleoside-diphosphate reductase alpha chain